MTGGNFPKLFLGMFTTWPYKFEKCDMFFEINDEVVSFNSFISEGVAFKSGDVANVGQGSSRVFALWPWLPKSRPAQV